MKHTPGPWSVDGNTIYRQGKQSRENIASLFGRMHGEKGKADATLIAAAPQLLAALKEAAPHIYECCHKKSDIVTNVRKALEPFQEDQ